MWINPNDNDNTPLITAMTRMFAALEAIKEKQDRQEQIYVLTYTATAC